MRPIIGGLSKKMREKILRDLGDAAADAVRRSCDWADVYIASSARHTMLYDDGRTDTLASSRVAGLGVRIVRGDDTAYATAAGSGTSALRSAIDGADTLCGVRLACAESGGDVDLIGEEVSLPSLDVGLFRDIDAALRSECRHVRQVTMRASTVDCPVVIVRGDGSVVEDRRTYTSFRVGVVVERDGELKTGSESLAFHASPARFDEIIGAGGREAAARRALARAVLMLDASPCPAGVMPVVLEGTAGGTMIHEACGHSLEADIIQKDFSVFRDKIGESIAPPFVSIVDDATLPDMYGSFSYDDEGTPASRTVLVEDGVLKCYLTDTSSARQMGLALTGNARRESFHCAPMPRMTNTFVTPGETTLDEMLERAGDGLLVRKMGGGEVDPTSGDFVFYVSEGYLIKKGRISGAVKGATLTGCGPDALANIAAVGRDLVLDPGVCGKSGQSVPVTDGQPTLLIDGIIVGGSDAGDA